MVFVTVVIACWVKAQSAILRLFLAMRMFRVLTARPNPFSNCCWNPAKIVDDTEGLNRLAAEVDELRVLSQALKKVVPVANPWEYWKLYTELCKTRAVSERSPVPVPEVNGLLTGTLRSSKLRLVVMTGSKFSSGLLAEEPPNTAPGVAPPKPPACALRIPVSANHGLYLCTTMSILFSRASSTASCMLNSSFPSWMSWSTRGELVSTGAAILIGL